MGDVSTVVLSPGQAREVADVLSASHADYPPSVAWSPTLEHAGGCCEGRSQPWRETPCRSARCTGAVEGRRLLAAAVWLPPGRFPWSPLRQRRGAPAFLSVLGTSPRSFPGYLRMGGNAAACFPAGPHWYLEVLGVRPEAQGRGLGTRLVEPVLAIADREGVPCYLDGRRGERGLL